MRAEVHISTVPGRLAAMAQEGRGLMVRVCSCCKRIFGEKDCSPDLDGEVSHGVCPECLPEFRRQLLG
jgi:hypothetical protein